MIYSAITNEKDESRTDVKVFSAYNKFKDPRMNAKIYKICPHLFMPDEKWWVWVDGNLDLQVSEEEVIKNMTKDVAVGLHSERTDLYAEAQECKRLQLDDPECIDEQIDYYKKSALPVEGLGACYIIARRNTAEVRRKNEQWWAHVCRWSVRDQISFPYVWRLWDVIPDEYYTRRPHKKKREIWKFT